MPTWPSLAISLFALLISGITAWLTFFRRGRLVMTQPTRVFFGPDGELLDVNKNKVYLRTLLYCTAKRGFVLESLYLSVQRNETKQNFSIWVYGTKGDLHRGSGLFVPQEGLTFDHHFLQPEDGAAFPFLAGTYTIKVFAKEVGRQASFELMVIPLAVNESQARALSEPHTGLNFDWGPDLQAYHPHLHSRHAIQIPKALQEDR